jgi:hypothetical protein
MRKLVRVSPAIYAVPFFIGLLVSGVFLGGFGQTEANGSII